MSEKIRDAYAPPKLPLTWNGCRICGLQPDGKKSPMNIGPVRFWEPDDGWIIGSLCHSCHDEFGHRKPKPGDFAFESTNDICDEEATDEDAGIAIETASETPLRDAVEKKLAWARACRHDGIDPKSKFVVFSKDNPHARRAIP